MSWPQWSAGAQPPLPTTPLMNSTPTIVPPNLQYTQEQWAQMQQQNWQQWAQWQQQYQQWHQQYGAEFQKSMSAMNTTLPIVQPQIAPTMLNMAVPPPLPAETKPPLPREEPPPPPLPSTPSYQNHAAAPSTLLKLNNPTVVQPPRPAVPNIPRQDNRSMRTPTQPAPRTAFNTNQSLPKDNLEQLMEAEKKFDKQFADWEAQFNKWKEQNAEHPDKEQYREYEKKWETWRAQLLDRREQMRKKRLSLLGANAKPPSNSNQNVQSVMESPFKNDSYMKTTQISNSDLQGNGDDFLKTSNTNNLGGIPGLDLVKDDPKDDVIEKVSENKGPDYDAISKGINTILGDQKLLSMLNMVSQAAGVKSIDHLTNATSKLRENSETPFNQWNDQSNQSYDDKSNASDYNQKNNNQRDFVNNFDDQTRSSFTMGYNENEHAINNYNRPNRYNSNNRNFAENNFNNRQDEYNNYYNDNVDNQNYDFPSENERNFRHPSIDSTMNHDDNIDIQSENNDQSFEHEEMLKPVTVIDYGHKSLKAPEPDILIEPIHMFDYRHKPLNRIPYPQRPKWLSEEVKNIREFDPPIVRPYDIPNLRRYSHTNDFERKYDRYPEERWSRRPSSQHFDERRTYSDVSYKKKEEEKRAIPIQSYEKKLEEIKESSFKSVTLIEDLINPPGRFKRPQKIVIILRGPPGSGKTFLAKLIKDKEIENGGSPPRILSLDDYFMIEQDKEIIEDGKKVKIKEMVYEYEANMEESYRASLIRSFKKTITDGYFPFIIVDNINDKVKYFGEMWSFAKQNGFQVYICQMEFDVQTCTKRNIHGRSESDIKQCISQWEPTPHHHPVVDATSLIQAGSIPEVEMEEINSPASDELNDEENSEDQGFRSKWDNFDCSYDNLAKLDGCNKPLRPSRTMEEYLQLECEWTPKESIKPGQKRVRWADIEEQREQKKMRALGFVVGHTNWERMMDTTMGSSALTQTKYFNKNDPY